MSVLQTRSVPSASSVNASLPSGLNVALATGPGCWSTWRTSAAGGQDPRRSVVARGQDQPAVGAEGRRSNRARVGGEDAELGSSPRVPDARRAVGARP